MQDLPISASQQALQSRVAQVPVQNQNARQHKLAQQKSPPSEPFSLSKILNATFQKPAPSLSTVYIGGLPLSIDQVFSILISNHTRPQPQPRQIHNSVVANNVSLPTYGHPHPDFTAHTRARAYLPVALRFTLTLWTLWSLRSLPWVWVALGLALGCISLGCTHTHTHTHMHTHMRVANQIHPCIHRTHDEHDEPAGCRSTGIFAMVHWDVFPTSHKIATHHSHITSQHHPYSAAGFSAQAVLVLCLCLNSGRVNYAPACGLAPILLSAGTRVIFAAARGIIGTRRLLLSNRSAKTIDRLFIVLFLNAVFLRHALCHLPCKWCVHCCHT